MNDHNLIPGGAWGNKGGGRPKSVVREACAIAFAKRVPVLEAIADNEGERTSERIKAIDTLGKYGGLQQVDLTTDDKPIATEQEGLARAMALLNEARARRADTGAEGDEPG